LPIKIHRSQSGLSLQTNGKHDNHYTTQNYFNTLAVPAPLYGSANWTMERKNKTRITGL
jgi:hypothetical protein